MINNKIRIEKIQKPKHYDYTVTVMNRVELLLTKKELLCLYDNITELIVDDEEFWEKR